MTTKAFTKQENNIVLTLESECIVSAPFKTGVKGLKYPETWKVIAQWDTGAACSVIANRLAEDMELVPVGTGNICTANDSVVVKLYDINITLPNGVTLPCRRVYSSNLEDIEILIGMDIISQGDFAVTNKDERTKFSFQMPSTHDIDFLQEIKNNLETQNN
jgi:predicted aspartyl protease